MYVRKIYVRAEKKQPYSYSLDCHGGAIGIVRCALENMRDFSFEQNWVSDSDGSGMSVEVNSIEPAQRKRNFFVHIA